MTPPPPASATVFEAHDGAIDRAGVVDCLRERGFCILRNLFTADAVRATLAAAEPYLAHPAVAGAPGYAKVDHPKKLLNPLLLGRPTYDLVLNEAVIGVVEALMDSECILAETNLKFDRGVGYTYFPLHSDFADGWRKGRDGLVLTAKMLDHVVGVGAAIYLHDTAEGAFCYCDGTHAWRSPRGQVFDRYPPDERQAMVERLVRCDGRAGDIVLFDDRGFHGPDQPSYRDRLVILIDYYRVATFGRVQVTPMPVWTSDLRGLSDTQMRVLGLGADYMVAPLDYSQTRFRDAPLYGLVSFLIEKGYLARHWRQVLKKLVRRDRPLRAR